MVTAITEITVKRSAFHTDNIYYAFDGISIPMCISDEANTNYHQSERQLSGPFNEAGNLYSSEFIFSPRFQLYSLALTGISHSQNGRSRIYYL